MISTEKTKTMTYFQVMFSNGPSAKVWRNTPNDDDVVLVSDLLNKPPEEELGNDTAEALSAVEDAECGTAWIVEVIMSVSILVCQSKGSNGLVPARQRLHVIHNRAI